jgi:hypothetical protein
MISSTPATEAFEATRANRELFEDMSPQEINRIPMAEYARMTGRGHIPETVPQARREAPQEPQGAPDSGPQGISVTDMSMDEYASVRESLGVTGGREYGRGIFDSRGRDEWISAASQKSGRGGLVNSGVIESPKIDMNSRLTNDNLPVTGRQTFFRGQ